ADLRAVLVRFADASVDTLRVERIELYFRRSEPATVYWREVNFELVEYPPCFSWIEILVEGCRLVRVEVVQHHPDALRIRVVLINEVLHEVNPVFSGSAIFDPDRSPAGERFGGQKQVLGAVTLVLVVFAGNRARLSRARLLDLLEWLFGMLVETNERPVWVVWFAVE